MKKIMMVLSAVGMLNAPVAQAKIEADSCSIKVIQFFDRVYEGFEYVDEETLALFRDAKHGNFSDVELVDSIISEKEKQKGKDDPDHSPQSSQESYLKLYNKDVEDAYLEAIQQNLASGDYYATFKTSCSKNNLSIKNEEYKWKYKCKLAMTIGQFKKDDDGETETKNLVESSNRTVKMKIKDELSHEEESVIDDLRKQKHDIYEDYKEHRISKSRMLKRLDELKEDYQEEVYEPVRRDDLPEMRDQYRKMIEKFLKKNKFRCQQKSK